MTDPYIVQMAIANAFATLAGTLGTEASECGDERNALVLTRLASAHMKAARILRDEIPADPNE